MAVAHEKIKELAYRLWQEDGAPHGRDIDYWLQAEAALMTSKPKAEPKPKAAAKPKAEPKPKAAAKPKTAAAKPKVDKAAKV